VLAIGACASFEGDESAGEPEDGASLLDATSGEDGARPLDADASTPDATDAALGDAGDAGSVVLSPCAAIPAHSFCHDFDDSDGGVLLNGPGFYSTNAWDAVTVTGTGAPTYGVTRDSFLTPPYSFGASVRSNAVMLKKVLPLPSRVAIDFEFFPIVDTGKPAAEQKMLTVNGQGRSVYLSLSVDAQAHFDCTLQDDTRAQPVPMAANQWNHVSLIIDAVGSTVSVKPEGESAKTSTRVVAGLPGEVLFVGLEAGNQQWKAYLDNVVVDIVARDLDGGP